MITIIVDHTKLDGFNCPMFYKLRHKDNIVAKRRKAALSFGGAWHCGMSELYAINPKLSPEDRYLNAIKAFEENYEDREDELLRTTQKLRDVFKAYTEKWVSEPFRVIYNEHGFAVELGKVKRAYPEPDEPIIVAGRMDAIILWGEKEWIYVFEHKTTTRMGATYADQFHPNLQMDIYYILCEALMGRCDGIYINAAFIGKSKMDFSRPLITISKRRIELAKANILRMCSSIIRAEEWNCYPQVKSQCHRWGNRGCEYTDLCESGFDQRMLELQYERKKWNPLLGKEEAVEEVKDGRD